MLTDALSLPETPVPLKVARLLLASDILHNSTAPVRNASRYRSLLEAALPDIFESLQVRITRQVYEDEGRRPPSQMYCLIRLGTRLLDAGFPLLHFLDAALPNLCESLQVAHVFNQNRDC